MSTLADLFDDERSVVLDTTSDEEAETVGAHLEAMIGVPRAAASRRESAHETARLVEMVDIAAATALPITAIAGASPAPGPVRGHKRTDWVNVVAAVIAVVVVAGAAVFGVVQIASASPTASAVRALTADEASLVNAQQAFESTRGRTQAAIDADIATIDLLDPTLASLSGTVDETARANAVSASAAFRSALDAITLPVAPAPYQRPAIDEDSLSDVGGAIDAVRIDSVVLGDLTADLREIRGSLITLEQSFLAQMQTFATTIPPAAAAVNGENADAEQTFRDAVTGTAAAMAAVMNSAKAGSTEATAYVAAVGALRADQARAVAEAATAEEAERLRNSGGGYDGGFGSPEVVSPEAPIVPTDPVPTVPPVVEPTPDPTPPVDPQPPIDPQPPVEGEITVP